MHAFRIDRRLTAGGWLTFGLVLLLGGCGSSPTPASPTVVPGPTSPSTLTTVAVSGTVSDAAFRPLAGATVQATAGAGAGQSATTDSRGHFNLFGAFDATTQFRATREGHTADVRPLPDACARCNPNWWIHFALESLAPHPDLSGDYTLTLLADDRCVGLPDELRSRTFEARVTKSVTGNDAANSRFDVTVRGSSIVPGFDRFVIGMAGDYLAADIGDWGHSGAGLVERVGVDTYFAIGGGVSATVAGTSTISAPMHGDIAACELPGGLASPYSCGPLAAIPTTRCLSERHQLVMQRR